eukprot:618197-Rhodomonas_salina.2
MRNACCQASHCRARTRNRTACWISEGLPCHSSILALVTLVVLVLDDCCELRIVHHSAGRFGEVVLDEQGTE